MSQIGQNKTQSTFSYIGYAISHSHAAWGSHCSLYRNQFNLDRWWWWWWYGSSIWDGKNYIIFRSHVICITLNTHTQQICRLYSFQLTNIQQYNVVQYVTHKKWSVLLVCARTRCYVWSPYPNSIPNFFPFTYDTFSQNQWTK